MERLHFEDNETYSAIEGAIHIARYAVAKSACKGLRVLDIACGEGYGSYLMAARWGAERVLGVDISQEAIVSAKKFHNAPNIQFETISVYDLDKLVEPGSIDLIVSLETIEHLDNVPQFLRQIRRAGSANATFIISCPNDYHYYPEEGTGNPYHFRKYHSQEFIDLVSSELGPCVKTLWGTPLAGFSTIKTSNLESKSGHAIGDALSTVDVATAIALPPEDSLTSENCSYFVGVWGAKTSNIDDYSLVFYPTDMRSSGIAVRQQQVEELSDTVRSLYDRIDVLNHEVNESRETARQFESRYQEITADNGGLTETIAKSIDDLKRENRRLGLRSQALLAENELVRDRIWQAGITNRQLKEDHNQLTQEPHQLIDDYQALRQEHERILATVPWRAVTVYRRLGVIIPKPLLRTAAKVFDYLKHMRN